MKRFAAFFLFISAFFFSVFVTKAQEVQDEQIFKGTFYNEENRVSLVLNLYTPTLYAPNYGFLGELNGYLHGKGVYGMWFTTSHKIEGSTAILRMSNDIGSDAQTIEFRQLTDSTFSYKAVKGNEVKKVVGRKLVHIPSSMIFKKISSF